MAKFGDRSIAIVGHRFDQNGDAADAVAFVCDFLVIDAFEFARSAFYRAVNRVVRHILRFRVVDGFSQTRIRFDIAAAAAFAGSDANAMKNNPRLADMERWSDGWPVKRLSVETPRLVAPAAQAATPAAPSRKR